MKKTLSILGLLAILALPLAAQTVNPAPVAPSTNPLGTIWDYFTGFDTNLPFADSRVCLWTGASSIQGASVPLVNDVGGSYDIVKGSSTTNGLRLFLAADADERNSGIQGTIVSAQAGLFGGFTIWDVRAGLYCDGGAYIGNSQQKAAGYGEFGLKVFKKIARTTFSGVGFGQQFPKSAQIWTGYIGFNF